jgi:hypothetical protein
MVGQTAEEEEILPAAGDPPALGRIDLHRDPGVVEPRLPENLDHSGAALPPQEPVDGVLLADSVGPLQLTRDRHEVGNLETAGVVAVHRLEDVGALPVAHLPRLPAGGVTAKRPARPASRIAPKTLGESSSGRQHQSMEPSRPTRATVRRLPMAP